MSSMVKKYEPIMIQYMKQNNVPVFNKDGDLFIRRSGSVTFDKLDIRVIRRSLEQISFMITNIGSIYDFNINDIYFDSVNGNITHVNPLKFIPIPGNVSTLVNLRKLFDGKGVQIIVDYFIVQKGLLFLVDDIFSYDPDNPSTKTKKMIDEIKHLDI